MSNSWISNQFSGLSSPPQTSQQSQLMSFCLLFNFHFFQNHWTLLVVFLFLSNLVSFIGSQVWSITSTYIVCLTWLQLNRFCSILSIVEQLEEFFKGRIIMWGKYLEICHPLTTKTKPKDVSQIWWISLFSLLQICYMLLRILSLPMYLCTVSFAIQLRLS